MPKKTLVTLIALLVVLFAFSAYAFVNRTGDDDDDASVAAESSTTQDDASAPSNNTDDDSDDDEDDDRDETNDDDTSPSSAPLTPPSSSPSQSSGTYTMTDIATHNTESSCWAAVNSSVYDLTTWVSRHPGGSRAIVGLCGTNATSKFEAQHGGSRAAQAALVLLKIGTLTN